MREILRKMIPDALVPRLKNFFFKKKGSGIRATKMSSFYQEYASLANPVYHPHLEEGEFSKILTQVQKDVDTETHHDPYARAILFYLLKRSIDIEGDVIEFGVHHGGGSHLMGFVLGQYSKCNKTLWSLDSFEGLSEPNDKDIDIRTGSSFFKKHDLNNVDLDYIKSFLSQHRCNIEVVKGWIPESLSKVTSSLFSFAHIDVDLYQPIFDSLSFVYDKMSAGGVILLDDYGFPMLYGAKQAIDEFFKNKNEDVIPLPTGQAVVFKK